MKNLHDLNQTVFFSQEYTFTLTDHIKNPLFWWPQTLLSYSVDFTQASIRDASELFLWNEQTNAEAAFQLTEITRGEDGTLANAKLHFLSDLPSGQTRSFTLKKGAGTVFPQAVTKRVESESIWLDNGIFAVELPLSQVYPTKVPGPFERFQYQKTRYGSSTLDCGKKELTELETVCTEDGCLFTAYKVTYTFSRGGTYEATIRMIQSMDFIQFDEKIDGLTESDAVVFRFNWNGLNPTHRHAPNNPSLLSHTGADCYENYNWEKIEEPYVEMTNHPLPMWGNKAGEIPFRLAQFEPQAALARVTFATFWNEDTSVSAGAFITDTSAWDDKRYDLYASWNGFAVSFYYQDGLLWWKYPILEGVRKTAVTLYDHRKDKAYFESVLPKEELDRRFLSGGTGVSKHGASYLTFLQNRYSLLHLNRVKDFVLEYPRDGKRLEKLREHCGFADYREFEEYLFHFILVQKLPTHGQTENAGFHSVTYRRLSGIFFEAYNCLWDTMPDETRKRIEAILLLLTYYAAAEDAAPIIHMLGGPPNLNHDVKKALPYLAAMFPEHPHANFWGQVYIKSVRLQMRFSTRPDLKAVQLTGGRWAENIGTYTWAFLSAAVYGAKMLTDHNGFSNGIASKYAKMVGNWLVYSLTAPFNGENPKNEAYLKKDGHFWGSFLIGGGPHRVHLPIGAHAARRCVPKSMEVFATQLERYAPLLAENIRYICPGFGDDFERYDGTNNAPRSEESRLATGTRPDFHTQAFTGFGVMLRSGVYTKQELSVFLQQIDEGPNYRWGTAGGWGNGNLYYYANGNAYSHNGMEDSGDRRLNDCDVGCNFAVWRNGAFKSIGPNVLTNGYHDLGTFQFAAITPDQSADCYSYPEYLERSVLVSGTDYISIYDVTGTEKGACRFSWSVHSNDEFPEIYLLSEVENRVDLTTHNHKESIDTRWYDGRGRCYSIVTHRKDLDVCATACGAIVSGDTFRDILFRQANEVSAVCEGVSFVGKVGAVRFSGKTQELSLLRGKSLKTDLLSLETEAETIGVSLKIDGNVCTGKVSSLHGGKVRIRTADACPLYVDAQLCSADVDGWYDMAAGEHQLECTAQAAIPMKPVFKNAACGSGCCALSWAPANGAVRYEIAVSSDLCVTWQIAGATTEESLLLNGLQNGQKYFVRVAGINAAGVSGAPCHEYPIYPTDQAPLFPEGLEVRFPADAVVLTWGEVLGAARYHLYAKNASGAVTLLYSGAEPTTVLPISTERLQFAVSAENLCGEGEACRFERDNDPESLANYDPLPCLEYSRNSQYCHHPFQPSLPHKYKYISAEYPTSLR